MTIDVLGTEYELLYVKESQMEDKDDIGECDRYSKIIRINKTYFNQDDVKIKAIYKTMVHEITHAFLHEAGLDCYSEDEVLVDALAILIPKIMSCLEETYESFFDEVIC